MLSFRSLTVILALLIPAQVAAEAPRLGSCKYARDLDSVIYGNPVVVWQDQEAFIQIRGEPVKADLVSVRYVLNRYRFSFGYEDILNGPSELLFISVPDTSPQEWKVGHVSYRIFRDGTRILSNVDGYKPATCVLSD